MSSDNDVHSYTTYRDLDTGDSSDRTIECGTNHVFAWVGSTSSSSMVKHNKSGRWELYLDSDCSVLQLCSSGECDDLESGSGDQDDDDMSSNFLEVIGANFLEVQVSTILMTYLMFN